MRVFAYLVIYNSRNYQSLLAYVSKLRSCRHLQQQKLLELTSHPFFVSVVLQSTIVEIIRAYQPLNINLRNFVRSTIVEIIRAYQPTHSHHPCVEIYNSRNYQSLLAYGSTNITNINLQQQKLLELTSLCRDNEGRAEIYNSRNYQSLLADNVIKCCAIIYNSRNYQSLLAPVQQLTNFIVSTIVEIIRAYQPG